MQLLLLTHQTLIFISYTRSQGLFAGVAIEGSKIAYDTEETEKLYQRQNLTVQRAFERSHLSDLASN